MPEPPHPQTESVSQPDGERPSGGNGAPVEPATMGRLGRLSLVAGLYSTQNLCLAAYTYTFLIAAQRAGTPLELIGSAGGLAMIIVLKFLWAPLVDRFGSKKLGHYRGWLIVCQSLLAIGALAAALLDPGRDFAALLVIFGLLFVIAGTQDVAADATTTRILGPSDRGLGNGIQSAGGSFAQVMGGGLLLFISGAAGWGWAMVTLAVLSALPLPLVLHWPEQRTTGQLAAPKVSVRSIAAFFGRRGVKLWAFVLVPLYVLGGTAAYNLVRPLLTQAGWSDAQLGGIVVIGGGIAGILGGVLAGLVVARLGRRRSLLVLGLVQLASTAATILLTLQPTSTLLAVLITVTSNASFAAAAAVIYTISMDLTRLDSSGTDFTALSTLSQVVMVIAASVGISMAGKFGFVTVSIVATLCAAVGLALVVALSNPVLEQAEAGRAELVESAVGTLGSGSADDRGAPAYRG